jgi:hypothetical protein
MKNTGSVALRGEHMIRKAQMRDDGRALSPARRAIVRAGARRAGSLEHEYRHPAAARRARRACNASCISRRASGAPRPPVRTQAERKVRIGITMQIAKPDR